MPMDQLNSEANEMARERDLSPPRKKQSALKKIVSSVFRNRSKMEVGSVPPPLCFQEQSEESSNDSSPKVVRRKVKNRKKDSTAGEFSIWRPKV